MNVHQPKIQEINAIQEELISFLYAIQSNNTPVVTLNESCEALRIAHVIIEKINERITKNLV